VDRRWQIYLGSAALICGLVLSQVLPNQLQAQADPNPKNKTLVETIKQLESNIALLENEIASAREDIERHAKSKGMHVSDDLQIEVQLQQAAAGLTELTGEGIVITLDDNSAGAQTAKLNDPANYRPNDYIIHDKNLLYLVNELKQAKAQGISINGQRIASSSDIRCVGTVIMINSTRVAPPFEISAIGNANKLKKAVEEGREYLYLKQNKFPVKIDIMEKVVLPAYTGSFNPKYMTSDQQGDKQ
jgi:uncharacterized protein YlxW (UPF0749 family)